MNIEIDIDNIKLSSKVSKEEFELKFPNASLKKYDNNIFEYSLTGLIFEMNYSSDIIVYYKANSILQISVFPSKEKINDQNFNLQDSYNDYNTALENIYGKKFPNIFGKQKVWHFSDAIIKHYLFERFCKEERIEVLFKK